MVCLDYIGAVNGYQFDILRARAVGEPDPTVQQMIKIAYEATMASFRVGRPGMPVREVVKTADQIIGKGGFLQHRAKFTGHGIGLDTVEAPFLMEDSDELLQPGDVICLEPGILIRDVAGARFEYEAVITDKGCEFLVPPTNPETPD